MVYTCWLAAMDMPVALINTVCTHALCVFCLLYSRIVYSCRLWCGGASKQLDGEHVSVLHELMLIAHHAVHLYWAIVCCFQSPVY